MAPSSVSDSNVNQPVNNDLDGDAPPLEYTSKTPTTPIKMLAEANKYKRGRLLAPWAAVAYAIFAVGWGGNEFTPLLGLYRATNHLSAVSVNILLGSYVLGIIPAMLIGGSMSDRYGRRPVMRLAPLISMAGSALIAIGARSFPEIVIGRVFSGIALGIAMTVGFAWVKELSEPPFETKTDVSGARRASLSLTAGFALGAAVAAALAQFAPLPAVLAYAANILITLPALLLMWNMPETVDNPSRGPLLDDLRIPAARRFRFWLVVAPAAPWVFGCAACAYAILPAMMSDKVGSYGIGFSGLMCMIALGCGFFIQPFGKILDRRGGVFGLLTALAVVAAGMVLAAIAISTLWMPLIIAAAALLGCGFGLALVGGLTEIQRIARPDDLAGLTGVYYSLAYLGFFTPMVLAMFNAWFSYPVMFIGGAVLALVCLVIVHVARDVDNHHHHLEEAAA